MMKMRLLAVLLFCLSVFLVSPKLIFAADPSFTISDTSPALPANPAPPISINSNPALPFVPPVTSTVVGPVPNTNTGAPASTYYDGPGSGSSGSTTQLVPCDGTDCTIQMILTMGVKIYNYLTGFGAILAVGAIVVGGFSYITAQGDSSKMSAAKEIIVNAIIGIVVLAASALIVNTVMSWMGVTGKTKQVEDVKAQ